jgi:hypothetical protein
MPDTREDQAGCINCGAPDAPHLGETRTIRVADGVVRDDRTHRCTPCQCRRYEPQELQLGTWAIRDRWHGILVVSDTDTTVRLYMSQADAQADADREEQVDGEVARAPH